MELVVSADSYAHTNPDTNAYTDACLLLVGNLVSSYADSDSDTHSYSNPHADTYTNPHAHPDPDSYTDSDPYAPSLLLVGAMVPE